MNNHPEFIAKATRVFSLLEQYGCSSLVITRRENFAWLSCGGSAVTSYLSETSPVYLLITPDQLYAVGYNMDLPRTVDEELSGLGFVPVSLPTFGRSIDDAVGELAVGKLAADRPFQNAIDLSKQVTAIHEPLLPEEQDRYRAVAMESGEIVRQLAEWVEPGMTERQVLGHMWGQYLEHGFEGDCMFVVSDERIRKYRHAVPCNKTISDVVILAPAVCKKGLHVQISRMVYFRPPTGDELRRFDAVATIHAALITGTRPGVKLVDLMQSCFGLYETLGFPEEQTNHWHGGPTGYRVSYPERSLDPTEVARPGMAFSWYITVAGAKSEETVLLEEQGASIISADSSWPSKQIEICGQQILMPDLLRR